jgi:hypothetical protein
VHLDADLAETEYERLQLVVGRFPDVYAYHALVAYGAQ